MPPWLALAVLVALVVAAGAVGLLWRFRAGRVLAPGAIALVTPEGLGIGGRLGERATLLQFSTEFCAQCPGTRRMLTSLTREHDGVAHLEVDLTDRPELARRFRVLQTPTVLLLDARGGVRGRIGGAPRLAELRGRLSTLIEGADDVLVD